MNLQVKHCETTARNRRGAPPNWYGLLVREHPDAGFMQAAWWPPVLQTLGWWSHEVRVAEAGAWRGGANIFAHRHSHNWAYYYLPDGPILHPKAEPSWGYSAATMQQVLAQIDLLREREDLPVSHLRLEAKNPLPPSLVPDFIAADGWVEPRTSQHIDLAHDDETLLANMTRKGRYNTNLALRKGVQVTMDNSPKGIADFLEIYYGTMGRKGAFMMDRHYLSTLCDNLIEYDAGGLFFASYQDMRLAAALTIFHGHTATYFFGGARNLHRNLKATCALQYGVMRHARDRGLQLYDLYGVSPPDQPHHQWASISEFKRQFGGVFVDYGPALDLVYDRAGYDAYLGRA